MYFLAIIGAFSFCWGAARLIEQLITPSRPTVVPVPVRAKSLEETLKALQAASPVPVIDPVRASRDMELRDPNAFAPTAETIALARQFQRYELRLKARKARAERWAIRKAYIRSLFNDFSRALGFWN